MNTIFKITIFVFSLIIFGSCENDKDPVVSKNGVLLRKDQTIVTPTILTQDINTTVFAKLNWDKTDNGVTSVSTYSIIISDHDADPNFENPIEYNGLGLEVSPESRICTFSVKEFNDNMNKLATFKCSEMNIDIRVKSKLGIAENALYQYSNPITVAVTGYSTRQPIIAFVKDGEIRTDSTPTIVSSSFDIINDYQGYMYLEPGNYKFYQPDACGSYDSPTIYGGNSGVLEVGNTATSIVIATSGHYLVKADLTTGNQTYSVKNFTTFGIFGKATRPALDGNQVPMTYDSASKTWKLTVELRNGNKFKFKSNLWTGNIITPNPTPPLNIQYPPYAPGTSTSSVSILGKTDVPFVLNENNISGSGDITLPGVAADNTRSTYEIILDVSKPRNYTYKLTLLP